MQTIENSLAEARAWIASGEKTDDLWLLESIDEVYLQEQKRIEIRGCCSVGCSADNIVESDIGPVCKWSRRPCEKMRLGSLVELLSEVNKGQLPSLLEGIHCDRNLSR